jgi:glutamine synthetase
LKILEEVARALEGAEIELQMIHAEAAPGQFEVVTGPLPPLEAADALIFTRETIANIANKYGLHATLAPRVFDNSCNVHL